jgi:LacI family transcriptional regulator
MAKRATLKEVAEAAGVSVASASYAINGTGTLGAQTREHILAVAGQLGYRPNHYAKAMKTGRFGAIGLVVPDLTNPVFPNLALAVIQTARNHGYSVFLTNTEGSIEEEFISVNLLAERGVDGVIWFPAADTDAVGSLITQTPTVVLSRNIVGYDVVQADDALGGEIAATHVVGAGHERIALITGPLEYLNARQRAQSAQHYIETHAKLAWSVSNPFSIDLEPAVREAIDRSEATAIIAGSDLIAIGAIHYLQSKGMRVPEDVSVLGFDDIPWAQLNSPPLTTIELPIEEMAVEAVEMLVRRIAHPSAPTRRIAFNVNLVERGSVRKLSAG